MKHLHKSIHWIRWLPVLEIAAVIVVGIFGAQLVAEFRTPPFAVPQGQTAPVQPLSSDQATQSPIPPDEFASIPERVWSVTLTDVLFPDPPPPEPAPTPPPPPKLQMIAITGAGDARRVFVRDLAADKYFDLAVGESVSSHITVASIDAKGATFNVAGQTVRMELPR